MLHSYAFSNFRSFRERVEVDLTLTEQATVNGWDRHSPISGQRLTTAMAILGPNASGKTSLIQPLSFLAWFIPHSFTSKPDWEIPIMPHFAARHDDAPTDFEVITDAEEPETLWRYRLSLTRKRVLAESVEIRVRRGQWRLLFDRRWRNDGYEVAQDGFGLDPTQAAAVRPNVSLISWAAQFGVPMAQRLASFTLLTNMNALGRILPRAEELENYAKMYAADESLRARMAHLLAEWDLGLSDVVIHQYEAPGVDGVKEPHWFPVGVHKSSGGDTQHILPFAEESSGTKAAFTLLAPLLLVLKNGGVLAYDELDGDLHPMLLELLLDQFASPVTNPHNAQIIFTCHTADVMRSLQKSQIMLVEKEQLQSTAWRLDAVKGVRSDENRVAKYLSGAYGAVPRL